MKILRLPPSVTFGDISPLRGDSFFSQKGFQAFCHFISGEFSRIGYGACQFPADFHRDLIFPGGIGDGLLQYRIQFFHRQHFRQSLQELKRQLLGEGIGRSHLKDLYIFPVTQDLFHVFVSHAAADDAFCPGTGNRIEPVAVQVRAHLHQLFLQSDVVFVRKPRENDPLRILFKAFRFFRVDLSVDLHGLIPVADPRGGPHKYRLAVFLRILKGVLHHFIGFRRRRGVKYHHLRELGEMPRVLLRLGGDGARIIRRQHNHPAFHAHIIQAHQRVRGYVQAHLLHGHQTPGTGVGRRSRHLHGYLLVGGPLHVDGTIIILCNGLQHLAGRRPGISCHQPDTGLHGSPGDRLIPHNQSFLHCYSSSIFYLPSSISLSRSRSRSRSAPRRRCRKCKVPAGRRRSGRSPSPGSPR